MSAIDDVAVVTSFNEAINAQDLVRLDELMTEAHRFVDSAGATIDGRGACLDAWRGFFAAFPDYRNVFKECRTVLWSRGLGLSWRIRDRPDCRRDRACGPYAHQTVGPPTRSQSARPPPGACMDVERRFVGRRLGPT
jgi:hypothetical protein